MRKISNARRHSKRILVEINDQNKQFCWVVSILLVILTCLNSFLTSFLAHEIKYNCYHAPSTKNVFESKNNVENECTLYKQSRSCVIIQLDAFATYFCLMIAPLVDTWYPRGYHRRKVWLAPNLIITAVLLLISSPMIRDLTNDCNQVIPAVLFIVFTVLLKLQYYIAIAWLLSLLEVTVFKEKPVNSFKTAAVVLTKMAFGFSQILSDIGHKFMVNNTGCCEPKY